MARRDHYTSEQRARENEFNRQRMNRARMSMTPAQRSAEAMRRKERERIKATNDPDWAEKRRLRRSMATRKYYESRRDDPSFWAKRKNYMARWLDERRENEEFEAFMNRIEKGEFDA